MNSSFKVNKLLNTVVSDGRVDMEGRFQDTGLITKDKENWIHICLTETNLLSLYSKPNMKGHYKKTFI